MSMHSGDIKVSKRIHRLTGRQTDRRTDRQTMPILHLKNSTFGVGQVESGRVTEHGPVNRLSLRYADDAVLLYIIIAVQISKNC